MPFVNAVSKLAILGLATGLFAASAAKAETVVGYTLNPLPPKILGIHVDGSVQGFDGHNYDQSVYAGTINWCRTGGTDTDNFNTYTSDAGNLVTTSGTHTFSSFCIDIIEDVYVPAGPYTYDVVAPTEAPKKLGTPYTLISTAKSDQLKALWHDFVGDAFTDGANANAAFQIAIWNIVFDTDNTATAGAFRLTSDNDLGDLGSVGSLANAWLAQSLTDSHDASKLANLVALSSPSNNGPGNAQDQLVSLNDNPPEFRTPAVPLPLAAQGGVALFALLGANKLRKRRA